MPDKTMIDYTNKIKSYLRSAEVIEGKNKCFAKLVQGTISAQGAYTPDVATRVCTIEYTPVIAGETYVVSIDTSLSGKTVQFNEYRYSAQSESAFIAYGEGWKNSGTSFTIPSDTTTDIRLLVRIAEGDNIIPSDFNNIMVCTLDDWNKSHAYEPYYVPVKDSKLDIADQQVLGAWNELENNLVSTTVNGVTYTKKSDGTVDVTGQVTTGQSFAHAEYITTKTYPAGTYYYSDGLTGDLTHKGTIIKTENNSGTLLINTLQGITSCTLTEPHKLYVRFYRDSDETGNYTIKPMLAPEPNQPYVPNAMTNRELTIQDLTSQITFDTNLFTNASSKLYVQGKFAILFMMGDVTSITAANTYQTIATLPIKPVFANVSQQFYWGTTKALAVKINTNGTVDIRIGDTSTGGTNWIIPFVIE